MHPVVREAREQIEGMLGDANGLLNKVQNGDLSDEVRSRLRDLRLAAKGLIRQVRYYLEKKWSGAEDWMIVKLNEIIAVCEVSLAEFKKVPASFTAAFAD